MRRVSALPSHPSPMVVGLKKHWARLKIWTRIAQIARRQQGSWASGARCLQRLMHYRRQFRGEDVTLKYVQAGQRYFWDLYAPGYPSKAFDNYIARELERSDDASRVVPPVTAVLAITRRCPLACEHCCEWHTLNEPDVLTEHDFAGIAEQLQALGTSQFFLSGGEPLSRLPAVHAILERVAERADVWLLSSGLGLGGRRARELKRAGLTGVVLSLDHYDPSEHDRFRGRQGAFDAVLRGAAAARSADLAVGLGLVPTRGFLASADALARYRELAVALGAGFVQLLEPKAVGHYAGAEVELAGAHQYQLEAFARATNFDREHARAPIVAHPDGSKRMNGCVGANRYVYVDTRGALHSCPFCRSGPELLAGALDVAHALERLRARSCERQAPHHDPSGMQNPASAEQSPARARRSLPLV